MRRNQDDNRVINKIKNKEGHFWNDVNGIDESNSILDNDEKHGGSVNSDILILDERRYTDDNFNGEKAKGNISSDLMNDYERNKEDLDKIYNPSFSLKFGDWTIDKGDYILPSYEERFSRKKHFLKDNFKKELKNFLVLVPVIIIIVLSILRAIFQTY